MDRFVKGKRKAIEVAQTQVGHSKSKCRKYDEAYLALGFTVNVVGEEERPMCVLCLKTLAADSMKPTNLRRHIETMHLNYFQKSLEFFKIKPLQQQASYKCAYCVAQCKKSHTIAEELILPAAIYMVSVMLDEASVTKLKTVPVSNNTISRQIHDIANYIEEQLTEKIKRKAICASSRRGL